eukprot:2967653-Rhodomonas_salina.1
MCMYVCGTCCQQFGGLGFGFDSETSWPPIPSSVIGIMEMHGEFVGIRAQTPRRQTSGFRVHDSG